MRGVVMRTSKVIISSLLFFIGVVTMLMDSVLKGLILISFVFIGMLVVEFRQLQRTVAYLQPLLFRCGRVEYVLESLKLLKKSLLLYKVFKNKIAYIEIGVFNVQGDYEKALSRARFYKGRFSKRERLLLEREVSYAGLKLGQVMPYAGQLSDDRDQLIKILALINAGQEELAVQNLLKLRESEAGNVIFREVNALLSELLMDSQPQDAAYYQLVANSFSKSS